MLSVSHLGTMIKHELRSFLRFFEGRIIPANAVSFKDYAFKRNINSKKICVEELI